jgi:hypothetical protein
MMDNFDDIKNRIQDRRHSSKLVNNKIVELEKKYSKPSKLYKMVMSFLFIMALFLSFALYAKKDESGSFIKETLGIEINFTSFNKYINNLLDFRVVNSIGVYDDVAVTNIPNYICIGEDIYTNGSSEVKAIDDGVVTYVSKEEDGYVVIIENDSNFRSTFYGVVNVSVKVNDRVYFDSVIGNVNENVKITFSKGGNKLTYEETLQLLK